MSRKKKNTKRPISNDNDADQEQTERRNKQMKYKKMPLKGKKVATISGKFSFKSVQSSIDVLICYLLISSDSNEVHEKNQKLNQKRQIPNLVDVLVQDTDDNSGMFII